MFISSPVKVLDIKLYAVLLSCCLDWLLIHHHILKDHTTYTQSVNSALVWSGLCTTTGQDKFELHPFMESFFFNKNIFLNN